MGGGKLGSSHHNMVRLSSYLVFFFLLSSLEQIYKKVSLV